MSENINNNDLGGVSGGTNLSDSGTAECGQFKCEHCGAEPTGFSRLVFHADACPHWRQEADKPSCEVCLLRNGDCGNIDGHNRLTRTRR